ncbi:glucan synthase-like 8 [Salvia divinorum]|uniref:Glucan synthase-like 8 n=1 Tax=Salvia divinorum TaxID=28513 RepID=A0ABD1FJE1_SALDI
MTKVYEDWERLVRAAVRKQELWQLFHDHSRTPSGGSTTTTSGSPASASPRALVSRHAEPRPISASPRALVSRHAEPLPSSSAARVLPAAEKQLKTKKSRLRLDRWVFTRWLSNTFHSTSP